MNRLKPVSTLARLTEDEFRRLGSFIHSEYGIKMPPSKKTMLEARLQKRLRRLGIDNFPDYIKFLFSPEGTEKELVHMVDVVTTNKTDFFREPMHFDFLMQKALPELRRLYGAGRRRPLALWSAGCSTGEEPYSLAMVLKDHADKNEGFSFSILATDISTNVLDKAVEGIYTEDKVAPVPPDLKRKFLLRSKDRSSKKVRVVPQLRATLKFKRLNFMEDFNMNEQMDVIFCRNVIIYFDRPTQQVLIGRLASHLVPGGFLFMGHSETLSGLTVPLMQAAPTIYRKVG